MNKKDFHQFCHDLKNPLTVMKCNLELLGAEKPTLKLKKFIKVMDGEIEKMLKIMQYVG
jgi:signal transduction histidine kinase